MGYFFKNLKCSRDVIKNRNNEQGFTLIELLVVISIMGLIAGSVIANFAAQRDAREVTNSENLLVTNIRKTQSYSLASRNLPNGMPAQYYIVKIDMATPSQYSIQAVYNAATNPKLETVETINLPPKVVLDGLSILNADGSTISPTCMLVAFRLPFAKVITNNGCVIVSPPTIISGDDYDNILQFISNAGSSSTQADSISTIRIKSANSSTLIKNVVVNGITGLINFY